MKLRRAVIVTCAVLSASIAACVGDEPASTGDAGGDASFGDGGDGSTVDGSGDGGEAFGTAPRQIAPLSTSRVTSRTPKLRWVLPNGVTDATLDLCLDRACTKPIGTPTHVTGTSYAPTTDLPVGVVFWRLHPSTETTVSSATWQFTVGARSAAVDTSWGTTLDVNGDGYADLAVGADGVSSNAGAAYVYLGSATGLATSAATPLTGRDGGAFGLPVASAGDVNGDGYADLIVGAPNTASSTGSAYVYLGSATGLAASPAVTLTGLDGASGGFGISVASAGDVNGDGYADIVIGANGYSSFTGRAYVYLGSATGIATLSDGGVAPATTLTGPDGPSGFFGNGVASVGDVNGDGYSDIVVGGVNAGPGVAGRAYVYLGSADGVVTSPTTLTGPDGANGYFGVVAGAGDVNGDGYADLLVGAYGSGNAFVYLGSATGIATLSDGGATPATTMIGPDPSTGFASFKVSSAGDLNGDGYSDLVIGAANYNVDTGRAYIYLGSATGVATLSDGGVTPATTITGPDGTAGYFGQYVASAGDVKGNGYSDLVISAFGVSNHTGTVYVYPGSATGLGASGPPPDTILTGPDGINGNFGNSVFGATN